MSLRQDGLFVLSVSVGFCVYSFSFFVIKALLFAESHFEQTVWTLSKMGLFFYFVYFNLLKISHYFDTKLFIFTSK